MIVIAVITVALGMFVQSVVSLSKTGRINREAAIAADAAREMVDILASETFAELFARYNSNDADDPDGAGTAPGCDFAVDGLDALATDADGMVGRIEFPQVGDELREDADEPDMGMPRDLNGDGLDAVDHSGDYIVLPVRIRLQWTGKGGEREFETITTLADL